MPSLDSFATAKLNTLEQAHLRRVLVDSAREDGVWIERDGKRLLSFSCNDYLNLTHHPKIKAAAVAAIAEYGAGAGASRLVTGNHPLFAELEARLTKLKQTEAACIFGSGYLANAGIIPALVGEGDLLLIDELSHSCLWAGSQLSRANVQMFRHNDLTHVEELLKAHRAKHLHALIVTDGVFSMDGDLAPLAELGALAQKHDAWLMSDDAHGLGVLANGKGSVFANGSKAPVDLQMGTLSKSLGSYGGYLCASKPVIDLIKTRARTLIYSTGLPPASIAAAIAALDIIESDPDLTARPLANAQTFTRALNLPLATSPIVPIVIGDEAAALEAQATLEREGFLVTAIRPPTVPAGTARLRLAFTAGHAADDIDRLAAIIRSRIL
jgi:8-amino-7-oxononanoate synthase